MAITLTDRQIILLRRLLPKRIIQECADLSASEGQRKWDQGAKASADASYQDARDYISLRDAIYPPESVKREQT